MKKSALVIVLIIFAVVTSFAAPAFTLVNSSFDETTSIERESEQYVDATYTGSYSSSDRLAVYIQHVNDDNSRIDLLKILDEQFYTYFLSLPTNPDNSRRVYFTMPEIYKNGKFRISINLSPSGKFGLFEDLLNRSISITSAASGLEGTSLNLTYSVSDGTGAVTWTITEGASLATINGSELSLINDGTITIKIEIAEDSKYIATSTTQTFTITPTVTGILSPTYNDINISKEYFDGNGRKIEKPVSGFFIWKASTGESGKVYIY